MTGKSSGFRVVPDVWTLDEPPRVLRDVQLVCLSLDLYPGPYSQLAQAQAQAPGEEDGS